MKYLMEVGFKLNIIKNIMNKLISIHLIIDLLFDINKILVNKNQLN